MNILKHLSLTPLLLAMIAGNAYALEALDEESMSATMGQDGISITIVPPNLTSAQLTTLGVTAGTQTSIDTGGGTAGIVRGISMTRLAIHDDDGNGAAAGPGSLGNSGALVFDNVAVIFDDDDVVTFNINSIGDSNGNTGGGSAMLNIAVVLPKLAISVGALQVANSDAAEAGRAADGTVLAGPEVDGTTISAAIGITTRFEVVIGAGTANIQLGTETQGSMLLFNTSITGGLQVSNLALLDAGGAITGGQFGFSNLTVVDNGGANLTVNVGVDIGGTAAPLGEGLYVTLNQFGNATTGTDIRINDLSFGSATAPIVGDAVIEGLKLAGTRVVIKGI